MDELLENYELFLLIFLGVVLVVYALWFFFFKMENEGDEDNLFKDKELKEKVYSDVITQDDKDLFQDFLLLLPLENGSIEFLENHTMMKDFHSSKLDELHIFYHDWNFGEQHFSNSKLEEEKSKLHILVEEYLYLINKNVEDIGHGHLRVAGEIDLLGTKAKEIVESYNKLSYTLTN